MKEGSRLIVLKLGRNRNLLLPSASGKLVSAIEVKDWNVVAFQMKVQYQ